MARDYASIIAALLAHADDEANSEIARQSYRDKAEKLMREYRIAEEEALATDPGSTKPTVESFTVPMRGFLGRTYFRALVHSIADHCEVETRFRTVWENNAYPSLAVDLVGYEGDVRYARFLWTSTYLMFSTRIDPTWSTDRTEAENIFLMRQAGIERREIADAAWGAGSGLVASKRSRVQSIYRREAEKRGEIMAAAGLGFNSKLYRDGYARQFVDTLRSRLWSARHAADAAGGAVTLAGRKERVQEAFYNLFPEQRPSTEVAEQWRSPHLDCPKCQKAKSGFCRDHNYLKPTEVTQADRERWNRQENSPSARAGRSSGRDAARGVVIQRGTPETGKMGPAAQRALD
jgi:hypothetical protein